jgi:hypothetical protein
VGGLCDLIDLIGFDRQIPHYSVLTARDDPQIAVIRRLHHRLVVVVLLLCGLMEPVFGGWADGLHALDGWMDGWMDTVFCRRLRVTLERPTAAAPPPNTIACPNPQ